MTNLAMQGHATRGKEVIEILEMLGGVNESKLKGYRNMAAYFIKESQIHHVSECLLPDDYRMYTLEEFLEKFPYKVGDMVQVKKPTSCGFIYEIIEMEWKNDRVEYTISVMGTPYKDRRFAEDLQLYKEQETMVDGYTE